MNANLIIHILEQKNFDSKFKPSLIIISQSIYATHTQMYISKVETCSTYHLMKSTSNLYSTHVKIRKINQVNSFYFKKSVFHEHAYIRKSWKYLRHTT